MNFLKKIFNIKKKEDEKNSQLYKKVNDDMIVATHKPYKKDYPDEYNIFNLDLKNKRLIKVTEVNKKRYTKYFDCKEIPLN